MLLLRRNFVSYGRAAALIGGIALTGLLAGPAAAVEGQLRIAKQFGVVYLLLNVIEDQKLVEKHGKESVSILRSSTFSSPAARPSTMRCSPARSISAARAWGRSSPCGTAPAGGRA